GVAEHHAVPQLDAEPVSGRRYACVVRVGCAEGHAVALLQDVDRGAVGGNAARFQQRTGNQVAGVDRGVHRAGDSRVRADAEAEVTGRGLVYHQLVAGSEAGTAHCLLGGGHLDRATGVGNVRDADAARTHRADETTDIDGVVAAPLVDGNRSAGRSAEGRAAGFAAERR